MTIRLPDHLQRFVHDQVHTGRYSTEDEVISDALEQFRQHVKPATESHGSLGAMSDAADELDAVVEHAMQLRRQPWRALPSK